MLAALVALLCLAAVARPHEIMPPLWRARWLFVSIIGVYSLTQSAALAGADYFFNPSLAGLAEGARQATRLALLIGVLVWLFPRSARAELLYAIYFVLLPLRVLRVDGERIAVRLGLTMHLALATSRASLAELLLPDTSQAVPEVIALPRPAFRAADFILIGGLIAVTLWIRW